MKPYAKLDRLDIGVSCGQNSEKYFEFFAQTALALASRPEILRFVVAVNNGADRKVFEALSKRFAVEIVEPARPPGSDENARAISGKLGVRSYMHGMVLNALATSFRSEIAVIADCDIAIVRKGWDEAMHSKLNDDVVMVGSGYPRENPVQNIAPKYRNFPNVTFCMLRTEPLRALKINFLPAGTVRIDAELAKSLGRKKGEAVYLDVGAELPVKLRRAGFRGICMPLVWPDEYTAKVLKPRQNWNTIFRVWWPHEFHLDSIVTCVHLGKSELRGFGQDPVAISWEEDVCRYLKSAGVSLISEPAK
jgi:hypothetical protein